MQSVFLIRSLNDCILLQQDIESLLMWSYIWGMNFNIDKCYLLSITRNNLPFIFEYKILDKPLQRVQHMRDLGVLINTNLPWGTHCKGLINKCNRTMGMIKRTVGFNAPVNVTTSLVLGQLPPGQKTREKDPGQTHPADTSPPPPQTSSPWTIAPRANSHPVKCPPFF